jgi:hypothetical protein
VLDGAIDGACPGNEVALNEGGRTVDAGAFRAAAAR